MNYIIIDGNNLVNIAFFRAKSIIAKKEPKNDNPVNMSFHIFLNKFHKYLKQFKEKKFIFVWDSVSGNNWRKTVYPEYKSHRVKDSSFKFFLESINKIKELLKYYPVDQYTASGLEADDLIFYLAKEKEYNSLIVISTDKDMIQIIQNLPDKNIKVYNPVTNKFVKDPGYSIIIYKALKGDKSDNIPGIKGIGEKGAINISTSISDLSDLDLNENELKDFIKFVNIIDISQNPLLAKPLNLEIVENDKYDYEKIKKFMFDHKLKSLLSGFDILYNF